MSKKSLPSDCWDKWGGSFSMLLPISGRERMVCRSCSHVEVGRVYVDPFVSMEISLEVDGFPCIKCGRNMAYAECSAKKEKIWPATPKELQRLESRFPLITRPPIPEPDL